MDGFLLSLMLLVFTTAAQAQFRRCFTDSGCTNSLSGPTSSEDCCVNSVGTYISIGGQCLQCIVYGWGASTFTGPESFTPHEVPLAYFKGPSDVSLIVDIIDTGEGTAKRNVDYTENDNSEILLQLYPSQTTSVTFNPDNFALEPNETIVFDLNLVAVNLSSKTAHFDAALPNVFYKQRTVLSIQDSTKLIFWLRESSREVDEDSGAVSIRVSGGQRQINLASPITLVLTPRVAEENFTPLPDTWRFPRANTYPGRLDFSPEPIKVTFPVGRTRNVIIDVPIIDDNINEELEFFRVDLSFADPASVPDTVSIGRSVMGCFIVDNDDIFIGFELPDTTYPEMEQGYFITLTKGAGNVTEQRIAAVVNLVQAVPYGTSFDLATPSDNYKDNDFDIFHSIILFFSPDWNETNFFFHILDDLMPENTESAQLTIEVPTEYPRFEIIPELSKFFIVVEDDDGFRVGFETLSYTVSEGVGSQQVCVRMFEPPDDVPITENFLVAVETVADTADESDFMAMFRFGTFIIFNNNQRKSCIDITITDDNVYENEERFFLQLTDLGGGFALPDIFVLHPNISEIIIKDDEGVTVGFIDPPYSVREDEGVMIFTVGVTSGHTLDRDIELSFSTDDIDEGGMFARAGLDYTPIPNLRFSLIPGMMLFQIPVNLINDSLFEQNEFFRGELTLISGERVTIGEGIANATIIDDEIVCQELELLTNGMIVYSPDTTAPYLEGTNAEHICNPGFFLIGNVIRVCQNDSTFSGVPPMCTSVQCLPLPDIENGNIQYGPDNAPNYDLGTVTTYTCNEGFVLSFPNPTSSATRVCIDDNDNDAEGVFDKEAPICVRIQCPALPDIPTGFVSYEEDTDPDFDLGTTATYMCDDRFLLVGGVERNCTVGVAGSAVGVWTGTQPTCVPIQCPSLANINDGVITYAPDNISDYNLGTIATYSCSTGFVLDFSIPGSAKTRECVDDDGMDANGVFDKDAPTCVGSSPREVTHSCLRFAIILEWKPPSHVTGDILKYELKFSIPGTEDMIFYKNGDQLYHLFQPNIFGSNQSRVTVQVRAHTVSAVSRWSEPVTIDC